MPGRPGVAKRGEACPRCGEVHTRCLGHVRKTSKPCMGNPPAGGKVCRMHGGGAPQVKEAADRREATDRAVKELVKLGYPVDIEPGEALLQQVREAAGNVAFLRERVQELEVLIAQGPFGAYVDPHVDLYDKERERLAKFAKLALDAGVAERQVQIAEKQGALVADVIRKLLDDPTLGLTPAQRKQGRVIAAGHLRLVG